MRFRAACVTVLVTWISFTFGQLPPADINQPRRDLSHTTIENPHGLIQDNSQQVVAITAARALGIPVEAIYGAALSNRAAGQLAVGTAESDPCVQQLQAMGYSLQDAARECERQRRPTIAPGATPATTPAVPPTDLVLRESLLPPPNIMGLAWLFARQPRTRANVEAAVTQINGFFGDTISTSHFNVQNVNNTGNNQNAVPQIGVNPINITYSLTDGLGGFVSPSNNNVIFLSEIYAIRTFVDRILQTSVPTATGTPASGITTAANAAFSGRRQLFRLLFGDAYMIESPGATAGATIPGATPNTNRTVRLFVLPQSLNGNHTNLVSAIQNITDEQRRMISSCSYRERIKIYTSAILIKFFSVAQHACGMMNGTDSRALDLGDARFNQTSIFSRLARERNILNDARIDLRTNGYLGGQIRDCYPDITEAGLDTILSRPNGPAGAANEAVLQNVADLVEFLKYPMSRGVINSESVLELTRLMVQLLPMAPPPTPANPGGGGAAVPGNQTALGRDCVFLENRLGVMVGQLDSLPRERFTEELDKLVNTYMSNLSTVANSGNRIGIRFIEHDIGQIGQVNHAEMLALLISYLAAKVKVQDFTVKVMNMFYSDLLEARPFLDSPPPRMTTDINNSPRTMFDLFLDRFEYLVSTSTGNEIKLRDTSKMNLDLQSLDAIVKSLPLVLSAVGN